MQSQLSFNSTPHLKHIALSPDYAFRLIDAVHIRLHVISLFLKALFDPDLCKMPTSFSIVFSIALNFYICFKI